LIKGSVIIFLAVLFESKSSISLFDKSELETVTLWQGDEWVLAFTDNENVSDTGGERVAPGVLDVSNVEGTWMLLDRLEDTNSTNVVTTGEVNGCTIDKLNNTGDFTSSEVNLESIHLANVWMWESEGPSVVSGNVWDLLLANVLLLDLAKLETGFFGINFVWIESSFGINQNSEELISFFNSNNVHMTKGESVISSDLIINLDNSFFLFTNLQAFLTTQGVLKPLSEQD